MTVARRMTVKSLEEGLLTTDEMKSPEMALGRWMRAVCGPAIPR